MLAAAVTASGSIVVKGLLYAFAFGGGILAARVGRRRAGAGAAPVAPRPSLAAAAPTPQTNLALDAACRTLCRLAENMASEVHEHATAMGAASQGLTPLCQSPEVESPAQQAAVKTVAANMRLQRRLEDAERQIRVHVGELRATRA